MRDDADNDVPETGPLNFSGRRELSFVRQRKNRDAGISKNSDIVDLSGQFPFAVQGMIGARLIRSLIQI